MKTEIEIRNIEKKYLHEMEMNNRNMKTAFETVDLDKLNVFIRLSKEIIIKLNVLNNILN